MVVAVLHSGALAGIVGRTNESVMAVASGIGCILKEKEFDASLVPTWRSERPVSERDVISIVGAPAVDNT